MYMIGTMNGHIFQHRVGRGLAESAAYVGIPQVFW